MQQLDEEIFGVDQSDEVFDRLMHRYVRKDWQQYEGALFGSKWFDYRFMHPVAATYVYAAAFVAAYKASYRATVDHAAAEFVRPMKHENLFDCHQGFISAIWRGRQHADAMGVPYDIYVSKALEGALRNWNRIYLPRPAQLYSGHVCKWVATEWEKLQQGILYKSDHSAYRTHRYRSTPAQNDHHEWLMLQATKRQNSFQSLLGIFESDLLPLNKIKERFGDDVSQRILQAA